MFNASFIDKCLLLPGLCIALLFSVLAGSAVPCTTCSMEIEDACQLLAENNSSAYDETMARAVGIVAGIPTPYESDFSNLSWSEAFLKANKKMTEQYAFTDWRKVDWDGLYSNFAPAISEAERAGNKAQYYRTLREYTASISDAHVNVKGPNYGSLRADIGGSFGFAVCRLSSGEVAVCYVAKGSQAEKAGIFIGDRLLEWNGMPVENALNRTSCIWAPIKPSTREGMLLQKARFLTRAPEGTEATAKIQGKNGKARDIRLLAFYDGYETLTNSTYFFGRAINDTLMVDNRTEFFKGIPDEGLSYSILPGGYGYVNVYIMAFPGYSPFRKAIDSFSKAGVPGIIVDLRMDIGGDDGVASCMSSMFQKEKSFYEYITRYNISTGKFDKVLALWSMPQNLTYSGPVAVLVSPYTVSSGEGIPMMISRRDLGKVISFYGTNGAFGLAVGSISMPLGLTLNYPVGQSLDFQGRIQIDSNASLVGGVSPDIRVPLTAEAITGFAEGRDMQLDAALEWLNEQKGRK
jgi:carboxyl-terminal processing protease